MRCLSIASALKAMGQRCLFVIADESAEDLLKLHSAEYIHLPGIWDDLSGEAPLMCSILEHFKPSALLVDSYFVTAPYLATLQQHVPLAYLDDLNAFQYPCDLLINYNYYADRLDYPAQYTQTKLLLGPKYAPLRSEFRGIPLRDPERMVRSILLLTGGTDPLCTAGQLISAIKASPQLADLAVHAVIGAYSTHNDFLRQLSASLPDVTLHVNVTNIAQLMQACDLAVSACGSTVYELCACGLPSVVYSLADNQLASLHSIGKDVFLSAGDIRTDIDSTIEHIVQHLVSLRQNKKRRQQISAAAYSLVDSQGAIRIAEALLQLEGDR